VSDTNPSPAADVASTMRRVCFDDCPIMPVSFAQRTNLCGDVLPEVAS